MSQNPKEPGPTKSGEDSRTAASEKAFRGTEEMPMPDDTAQVAGRNRHGRTITPPGEPGVITPEDDVLDTSSKGR